MRILGIDPGSRCTGWGVVRASRGDELLVEAGAIRLKAGLPFPERLAGLQLAMTELVERLAPDCAAVESPYHGLNARSALQLAHARGVILAVLAGAGVPLEEYAPATIKKAVTGNGRADKAQVRAMVQVLLATRSLASGDDLSDALAVALCHSRTRSFRARVGDAPARGRRPHGRSPGSGQAG